MGGLPKLMVMDSPSSLSVSSVAVTVNVLEVSVVLNVTVAGTAEWSAEVAPPLRITVRGMLTDVAGALDRLTSTVAAVPPSVAV